MVSNLPPGVTQEQLDSEREWDDDRKVKVKCECGGLEGFEETVEMTHEDFNKLAKVLNRIYRF